MGIPLSYSVDLPARCLRLIDTLLPHAETTFAPRQEHLGPLTTTFLLAMSTPMIVVPVERIERHQSKSEDGYVDERFLAPQAAKEIARTLGGNEFRTVPFFRAGAWSFASIPYEPGTNVARYLPATVEEALSCQAGHEAAERLPASQWVSCLRNALSHGGIIYLDRDGRQIYQGRTERLAFVSGKYIDNGPGAVVLDRLNFLSISEDAYIDFLRLWVGWLDSSGVRSLLAAE